MQVPASNVEYRILGSYDRHLVKQVVDIHDDSLSYESFMTIFGKKFLMKLYEVILSSQTGSTILALDSQTNVIGFILYATDTGRVFESVLRRPHLFAGYIIVRLLRRPQTVFRLVQTLSYASRHSSSTRAELLAIAVRSGSRSGGIGQRLIENLDAQYTKAGVSEYKVTVVDRMVDANKFYIKCGMRLAGSFDMYGKKWNLYTRKVAHEAK